MMQKIVIVSFTVLIAFSIRGNSYAKEPAPLKEGVVSSSSECGSCHKEIYEMWRESMHAKSLSDPIFQTSYLEAYTQSEGKAKKVCLNCHAPVAMINGDYDLNQEVTREGLTCHFCHSIVDADPNAPPASNERFNLKVGKGIRTPNEDGKNDYHTHINSPIHRKSELCAGCHEYSANGIKLMSTYSEWLNGPYAAKGVQCQSCHMPKQKLGAGKNSGKEVFSHYLAGGHSIMQIKKAVKVTIAGVTRGKDRVTIDLVVENSGSGHYVPTGIPTRKLILTCKITTGGKDIPAKKIVYEKILFDEKGRELTTDAEILLGKGSQVVKDNRLAPGEARKEKMVFYVEPGGEVLVSAKVDYVYTPRIIQQEKMEVEMNSDEKVFSE
ncbi:MAG: multiheme c-type cytochrome [Nitrospinota bacterium]|nr:multiheme c-type cytochrome [Nitrospinota bacterium]